jgi:hypothetical protein
MNEHSHYPSSVANDRSKATWEQFLSLRRMF